MRPCKRPPLLVGFSLIVVLSAASGCKTNESCRAAPGCAERGECVAKGLFSCVVATDADCAASARCKERGECVAVSWSYGSNVSCGPASDDDCVQSERCYQNGLCRLDRGRAESDPPRCVSGR